MEEKIDFYNLATQGLKLAENKNGNIKCAEIFFEKSNYINVEIEENSLKNSEIGNDYGMSIRTIDNRGSLGFAYTNKLNKKSIEKMIDVSIKMMNAGTIDADFQDLPSSFKDYPKVKGLYDESVKNLQIEDSFHYAEDLIKICNEDEQAISQTANFSTNYTKIFILNSNGLEIHGKETDCTVSSSIVAKDKVSKETSFGIEWQSERTLKDLNSEKVALGALTNAKRNLNRKKIKNMKCPLILTPNGTISMILSPIAQAINAEVFQYNRSFLVGNKDKKIGSKYLNIDDNALIDGALGSRSFDGEGVHCQNKKIMEEGKFLNSGLLHNSYTANKDGIESTGNASRSSYSSIPAISTSNFILRPGDFTKTEIFKDVKRGILLDYTGDSPNITTGDFSGLILHGNLIEDGEITHPLNETMLAINLLDLFMNIDAISRDFKVYGSYRAPFVRIKDVQILGSSNV